MPFANPARRCGQHSSAGSTHHCAPTIADFFAYAPGVLDGLTVASQSEWMQVLQSFGLPCLPFAPWSKVRENLRSEHKPGKSFVRDLHGDRRRFIAYYEAIQAIRHELPFDIDGIVTKIDSYALQGTLGMLARNPRWANCCQVCTRAGADSHRKHSRAGRPNRRPHAPLLSCNPCASAESPSPMQVCTTSLNLNAKTFGSGTLVVVQRAGDVIPEVVEVVSTSAREA